MNPKLRAQGSSFRPFVQNSTRIPKLCSEVRIRFGTENSEHGNRIRNPSCEPQSENRNQYQHSASAFGPRDRFSKPDSGSPTAPSRPLMFADFVRHIRNAGHEPHHLHCSTHSDPRVAHRVAKDCSGAPLNAGSGVGVRRFVRVYGPAQGTWVPTSGSELTARLNGLKLGPEFGI